MDKNESIKEEVRKLLTIWRGAEKFASLQVYCYWPFATAALPCWTVAPVKEGESSNSALDVLAHDPTRAYGIGFTLDAALESLRSGIIQRMLDESMGTEPAPSGIGVGVVKVPVRSDASALTHTDEGDVLDLNRDGMSVPALRTVKDTVEEYWTKELATNLSAESLSKLRGILPTRPRGGANRTTALYRIWAAANARFNRRAARAARSAR